MMKVVTLYIKSLKYILSINQSVSYAYIGTLCKSVNNKGIANVIIRSARTNRNIIQKWLTFYRCNNPFLCKCIFC